MMRRHIPLLLLFAIALASPSVRAQGLPIPTPAEPTPPPVATTPLPPQEVEEQMKKLEAMAGLQEENRNRLRQLYEDLLELTRTMAGADETPTETITTADTFARRASKDLLAAQDLLGKAIEARKLKENAQTELKRLDEEASEDPELVEVPTGDASVDEWKAALDEAEQRVEGYKTQLENLPQVEDAQQLLNQQDEAAKRSEKLKEELAATAPADEQALVTQSRQLALRAARMKADAEVISLRDRRATIGDRTALRAARTRMLNRNVQASEARSKKIREGYLRAEEALRKDDIAQARKALRSAPDTLKAYAQKNLDLATELPLMLEYIEGLRSGSAHIAKIYSERKSDLEALQAREDRRGLTNALGRRMRRQRPDMPDVLSALVLPERRAPQEADRASFLPNDGSEAPGDEIVRRQFSTAGELRRYVQRELDQAYERQTYLEDARKELPVRAEFVDEEATGGQTGQDTPLQEQAGILYDMRRNYMDRLLSDYAVLTDELQTLDDVRQDLVTLVEEFQQYVDERVLWIRSTSPIKIPVLVAGWEALQWLLSPRNWHNVGEALLVQLTANPLGGILLVLTVLLIAGRHRLRRWIRELGETVSDPRRDRFRLTLLTLFLTALQALSLPLVAWYAGSQLTATLEYDPFVKAVGAGLLYSGSVWYFLEFVRAVWMRDGLGQLHFRWRTTSVVQVRRNLLILTCAIVPLTFVAATMEQTGDDRWVQSLGRIAFMGNALALAWFALATIRPGGALMSDILARRGGGWLERLRYVNYVVLVLIPLALVVLSALGWHYTAQELYWKVSWSIAIALAGLFVNALALRGLFVLRRRLALEQARRRAEELSQQQKATEDTQDGKAPPVAQEPEVTLHSITTESKRLVNSLVAFGLLIALWVTWADVLPALGFLNRVTLWSTTTTGDEAAGIPATVQEVTLASLGLAVAVIVMTAIAARNIPGVLRIILLQRLPLDRGVRFAITTLCRYVIVLVGGVITFGAIGIGWSQVQWLVAAATVGLGFGLQEIFANFVSGIIILFERPMRVGDTVTVGDVSGTVSRIRIRATTITDWDRKELIVPNREFITGQLINWSLSDSTLRLSVEVGVAYGSDVAKVRRVLLDVAASAPVVLSEPSPSVHFTGFGGSSLNFALRCFVPDFDSYWKVRNELHGAIDAAFRENDIEIPFSQHDLHIRASDAALPVELMKGGGEPSPGLQSHAPDTHGGAETEQEPPAER